MSLSTYLVQWPSRVSRESKMQIQRQIHHILLRILDGRVGLNFVQAVAEEPNAIDEQSIRMALDLKVSEKGVCAEQRDDLVKNIVALAIGIG